MTVKCCFCKSPCGEHPNNAEPVKSGYCCDDCNRTIVIPHRIMLAKALTH